MTKNKKIIGKQNYILGRKFESFVAKIFIKLGEPNVKTNVIYKYKNTRSEFDIVYGFLRKHYVECKYKRNPYVVTTEEVSVFAKKLDLHNIKNSKGIIITNRDLSTKAREICKKSRINIVNRQKLEKLDYKRLGFLNSLSYKFSKNRKSLEYKIKHTNY
jgi:hypothetical protein